MPSYQWARDFLVTDDDVETLTGILLEREIPLSIDELALTLIEQRLQEQKAAAQERYKDVHVYRPSDAYEVGQTVMFPAFEHATAIVTDRRAGDNPQYGDFSVIQVEFEDETSREFAADFKGGHKLSAESAEALLPGVPDLDAQQVLYENRDLLIEKLTDKLRETGDLVNVAGKWFSRGLMSEVNEGYLNLAEAVLDIAEGGPLTTEEILTQVGGLGSSALDLQLFSMNDALNRDNRFDEVGPLNNVLWYLKREEPKEVQNPPEVLAYHPIDYELEALTPEQNTLEAEIDDEWSPVEDDREFDTQVAITLIFPHRRAGTLPLNAAMRRIFPTARRTQRIAVTLIDGQDGQEYSGWVVRQGRYVFGLKDIYSKHKLPVGAQILVRRHSDGDKIVVDFHAHRPRTEYVRLVTTKNNQIDFEDQKRAIGAEYDDLMIIGTDDLAEVDQLADHYKRTNLNSILRTLISELSNNSPQGTVHAKTLYSAVNVLKRCPPGPIFATLNTSPGFEPVGNHYWRLSDNV